MNDGRASALSDNSVTRFTAGGRSLGEDCRQANPRYQNQWGNEIPLRELRQSWHVFPLSTEFRGSETSASETPSEKGIAFRPL
jgi:hypothetical protein